jgi:hypothetical protein
MLLSIGLLGGFAVAALGILLQFFPEYRKLAFILTGLGLFIILGTGVAVILIMVGM